MKGAPSNSGAARDNRLVVWLDPDQVPLVRAAAELAGLDIVAAGSPRTGRSGEVATKLGLLAGTASAPDDLRLCLTTAECAAILIAAPGSFGAQADGSSGDLDALRIARERGVRIATLEPIPASALQLSGRTEEAVESAAALVPMMRTSVPMLAAREALAQFGPVRTLTFESWSRPHEGSVGARLYDAMDLVAAVMGEPESVHASYVWPGPGGAVAAAGAAGGGLRKLSGDTLRGLRGEMTCNLRFADGRGGSLALGDHGARWCRVLTLVGPDGRFRIYDDGFEWLGPDGQRKDASRGVGAGRSSPERSPNEGRAAAHLADALARLLGAEEFPHPEAPPEARRVLSMSGAALLSARTGEAESPDTIRRMALISV